MTVKLIDIRCACGKLLGKVQEGAASEHKCPRCKTYSLIQAAVTKLDEMNAQEDRPIIWPEHIKQRM